MRLLSILCLTAVCTAVFGAAGDKAPPLDEQRYIMSLSEAEHLGLLLRLDLRLKVRIEDEGRDSPNAVLVVSGPQRIQDGIAPFAKMLKDVRDSQERERKARHETIKREK